MGHLYFPASFKGVLILTPGSELVKWLSRVGSAALHLSASSHCSGQAVFAYMHTAECALVGMPRGEGCCHGDPLMWSACELALPSSVPILG